MAKTLAQIRQAIADLKQREQALLEKEVGGVIARIKEAVAYYGLTQEQIFGASASGASIGADSSVRRRGRKRAAEGTSPSVPSSSIAPKRRGTRKGTKVAIKYRDESGNTWTGRGSQPRWIRSAIEAGKRLEDFSV